jgi:uncharacterized membrane protein
MRALRLIASINLVALIFLCLFWESVWAPLRPGGSFLMLKALPLLAPLLGIFRGRVYTYKWSSMVVLAYLCEGIVRAWSERGLSQKLACAEIVLSLLLFVALLCYVRTSRALMRATF